MFICITYRSDIKINPPGAAKVGKPRRVVGPKIF